MTNVVHDPVCGMTVDPERSVSATRDGGLAFFCSDLCRKNFLATAEGSAEWRPPDVEGGPASRRIAYFSMEVGIDCRLPIYSGGLGILAGDTLRSFADLKVPAVGVSLLYAQGYFHQTLDPQGNQTEQPVAWNPAEVLRPLGESVTVSIENRPVVVRAWQYNVVGSKGYAVPLILLDTGVEENSPSDRELTHALYGGDERYRLSQEIVLGIGGARMLESLGYRGIEKYHMNEGHASLLALELLRLRPDDAAAARDIQEVKRRCVFTTHTPVPAGHDQFSYDLVQSVLGEPVPLDELRMLAGSDSLNMTLLALNLSDYVNGVAKKHGETSQEMFPGYSIDSITNGVHSFAWTCESFRELYDRYIPGWAHDPFSLRLAISIPKKEIWDAHVRAKKRLMEEVNTRTARDFQEDALTLGFARRATEYKRAPLVCSDSEALREIARSVGSLQLVFAGKAHPRDGPGKGTIRRLFEVARELGDAVKIVYLEDYDMELARLLTSGVDVWLNTPLRPLEASGTSGMKAAHNGVPSFSILDGWWIEGHIEGITGWSIGPPPTRRERTEGVNEQDARDLYEKLKTTIAPMFYNRRFDWIDVMRRSIAINASFFNAHRMVAQYAANAYL